MLNKFSLIVFLLTTLGTGKIYGQTGLVIGSLSNGTFIQGMLSTTDTFSVSNEPSGTVSVNFEAFDSTGQVVDSFTDNNTSNWQWVKDVGVLSPNSYIRATYYDNTLAVLDTSPDLQLNIHPQPNWITAGGTATVTNISGSTMTVKCNLPITHFDTLIPQSIQALNGKHVGINNCAMEVDVEYDCLTGNTAAGAVPSLGYDLNVLGLTTHNTESLATVSVSYDADFNLQAFTYSDSASLISFKKDFRGMSFPLTAGISLRISGGLDFDGQLFGRVVYGMDGADYGFINNGTDETRLYARATAKGRISAGLEVLGGVASVSGNLEATGGIGAGFRYTNLPSVMVDPIFGGFIRVDGYLKADFLFWSKSFAHRCFYGCDSVEGTFGNLPVNKRQQENIFDWFGGKSTTYKTDATSQPPSFSPQPTLATRDSSLVAVWLEPKNGGNALMISKLNSTGTAFDHPVIIEENLSSMSSPKVALLPSGSAVVTWVQTRLTTSDVNDSTDLDLIINSQDIWMAIYDEASGMVAHKFRLGDDTTGMETGRAEGEAKVAIGKGNDGIITWVSQDAAHTSSDVWYSHIAEDVNGWTLTAPDMIADLQGINYDVHVAFTDSTHAIATWINDATGNDGYSGDDSILDNNIMFALWDGNVWTTPTPLTNNNGFEMYDALSMSYNDGYCAIGYTSTSYSANDQMTKRIDVKVWDDAAGNWSANNSFNVEDTTHYFNKPRVSISDKGILSVIYQSTEKNQETSDSINQGQLDMFLKDLTTYGNYVDITGNPFLSDSTHMVLDVDAGFGSNNTLYVLAQEVDPVNGIVANPTNGMMFGDPSLSMVLRGLKVNNDLTVDDVQEPSTPDGINPLEHQTDNGLRNYPNPFGEMTRIDFTLDKATNAKLEVLDFTGRTVATLLEKQLTPGTYSSVFESGNLSNGIYFLKLTTVNGVSTRKIMIVK